MTLSAFFFRFLKIGSFFMIPDPEYEKTDLATAKSLRMAPVCREEYGIREAPTAAPAAAAARF